MDQNGLTVEDIQDQYLSASIAHINDIQDKADHIGKRKISTAERFLRDFNLAVWIDAQNTIKGNAPTVALVQQRVSQIPEVSEQERKVNAGSKQPSVSTKWVQRFRRKWGFGRGRFSARDRAPVAELRDNVVHNMPHEYRASALCRC